MRTNHIHVGPSSTDIVGNSGRHIQLAIDALSRHGGGVVELEAATYVLNDSLRMADNVALRGQGAETVLTRNPVVVSALRCDADKAQDEISPVDASLFTAGMGVALHYASHTNRYMPRYITHVKDNILYLDNLIDTDYIAEDGAVVANEFPMIHGERVDDVSIEQLSIDGGAQQGDLYGSPGIYVRTGKRWRISHVYVRNCIGDGLIFSQQSTHGHVEHSEFSHCSKFGVHPGSHSAHCCVEYSDIHHNGADGLYICWGITNSRFEHNRIHHNGMRLFRHGISIGHKDCHNVIASNHVYENAKHGIHMRMKTFANAPHDNLIEENIIENNGCAREDIPERFKALPQEELTAYGLSVFGPTQRVQIRKNIFKENRGLGASAIYLGPEVRDVTCSENEFQGTFVSLTDDCAADASNQVQSPTECQRGLSS